MRKERGHENSTVAPVCGDDTAACCEDIVLLHERNEVFVQLASTRTLARRQLCGGGGVSEG